VVLGDGMHRAFTGKLAAMETSPALVTAFQQVGLEVVGRMLSKEA